MLRLRFIQNYILNVVDTKEVDGRISVIESQIHIPNGKNIEVENLINDAFSSIIIMPGGGVVSNVPLGVCEILGEPVYQPVTSCCRGH